MANRFELGQRAIRHLRRRMTQVQLVLFRQCVESSSAPRYSHRIACTTVETPGSRCKTGGMPRGWNRQ